MPSPRQSRFLLAPSLTLPRFAAWHLVALLVFFLAWPTYAADGGVLINGRPIHPKVFNMVMCLISDTESPVVTAINIDAVLKNRNQFDYDNVSTVDGWVNFNDPDKLGTLRYKVISEEAGSYRIVYMENAGGSLTTIQHITFHIRLDKINLGGKSVTINNLVVDAIEP